MGTFGMACTQGNFLLRSYNCGAENFWRIKEEFLANCAPRPQWRVDSFLYSKKEFLPDEINTRMYKILRMNRMLRRMEYSITNVQNTSANVIFHREQYGMKSQGIQLSI